jgi:protocatechuate 3,4-dioxygenase beta subunit
MSGRRLLHEDVLITRRRLLALGVGAAVVAGTGCSDDEPRGAVSETIPPADPPGAEDVSAVPTSTVPAPVGGNSQPPATTSIHEETGPPAAPLTTADFDTVDACVLTPEQTRGPFYLQTDLVRRDISEDRPGSPLRVGLRLEDASDCQPIEGARVDIWHADWRGDYSAFVDGSSSEEEGEGTTFLRGTQFSDADGVVEFSSVFPGWYPSRAVHIHVMVYLGRQRVLTSQMYFSDDVIADVYGAAPYAERGLPDTPTDRDRIAGDPVAQGIEMAVNGDGDKEGRLALLRLHVPI